MNLWLAFTLMVAAAIFAVLWPLFRRGSAHGGSDMAVYRDQLDEITRDRAAGLIGEAEAEAAKIEVSRRLLSAADAAEVEEAEKVVRDDAPSWRRYGTALAALLLLPTGATALYLSLGSPQLPGEPLAGRPRVAHQDRTLAELVTRVEVRLNGNPDDLRSLELLAPAYLELGRFTDAVKAYRKLLTLAGETGVRLADLGEALAAADNGMVTAEAMAAFQRALALEPTDVKAIYYMGIAAEQAGDRAKAAEIWRAMLAKAPPDANWLATVRQALTRVGGIMPPVAAVAGPRAEDFAAAGAMNEKDRGEMIRTMVTKLADRLKENADDIEGWQRLLQAYMVLGERDKAHAAAADARRALASDPDKLRRIEDVSKSLGLQG